MVEVQSGVQKVHGSNRDNFNLSNNYHLFFSRYLDINYKTFKHLLCNRKTNFLFLPTWGFLNRWPLGWEGVFRSHTSKCSCREYLSVWKLMDLEKYMRVLKHFLLLVPRPASQDAFSWGILFWQLIQCACFTSACLHVCSTSVCAAPGHVFPRAAYDLSLNVSGLQQPCCHRRCLAYSSLHCTYTYLSTSALLELANVKLNCKYLISSIWPKPMQELVEKYIKLGPVLFYIQ